MDRELWHWNGNSYYLAQKVLAADVTKYRTESIEEVSKRYGLTF